MDERSDTDAAIVQLLPAERAKAFIDAVIAIAMTLLILPLMESASETGEHTAVGDWFGEHNGQVITFLISFAVIGSFWLGHHRVFSHVEHVSLPLLWLSIGWLLTIVWLPVATALTGRSASGSSDTVVVYIGSMLATAVMWLAVRVYLGRHPDLHDLRGDEVRRGVADSVATAILFFAAGALAVAAPSVGYYSLFVLFLSGVARRGVMPLLRRWTPDEGTSGSTQASVSADT
ncbi:DUF1211 domain-containing protein [Gordonia sp. PDNC005]|uniref:TMEM175 family protein n=1 Tax=unclassified Gordonia (in: high G+C Gram-positive bacteria) TaxID=2657482 RepID=UPI001963CE2A|nr:TMEM175 family protein [Gordonia sp. PDNC005]QRY64358.1 DUF1211 domain-containing protein [Gordonia sp. PDNC005]